MALHLEQQKVAVQTAASAPSAELEARRSVEKFASYAQRELERRISGWASIEVQMGTCPASWHPNGFATFFLSAEHDEPLRLHVWPDGASPDLAWHPSVHSHDRHVSSIVIGGTKIDVDWRVEASTIEDAASELYVVHRESDFTEALLPTGRPVMGEPHRENLYRRGEFFIQAAGQFHEIPPPRGMAFATLCLKSQIVDPSAQVLLDARALGRRPVTRRRVSESDRSRLLVLVHDLIH